MLIVKKVFYRKINIWFCSNRQTDLLCLEEVSWSTLSLKNQACKYWFRLRKLIILANNQGSYRSFYYTSVQQFQYYK